MFGFLEKIGVYLSSFLLGGGSMSVKEFNFLKPIVKPPVNFIKDTIGSISSDMAGGVLMATLGIVAIFLAITFIGKLLKVLMVGKAKDILHSAIGRGPISGIISGTGITVLVQSSSTTTSLIVPLAGSGVFSLRQIYPFTLGANIGTCITALLAATAIVGPNAIFALQIALIHFVYNLIGVVVIYGIKPLREIPIWAAQKLADAASTNILYAVVYVISVFFILPGILIAVSQAMGW